MVYDDSLEMKITGLENAINYSGIENVKMIIPQYYEPIHKIELGIDDDGMNYGKGTIKNDIQLFIEHMTVKNKIESKIFIADIVEL